MPAELRKVAFLALIAERHLAGGFTGWVEFAARPPDLLQKELLAQIYPPAVLQSPLARETFILPRR